MLQLWFLLGIRLVFNNIWYFNFGQLFCQHTVAIRQISVHIFDGSCMISFLYHDVLISALSPRFHGRYIILKVTMFPFKLLHRIITTRKEFKRYNMANDDLCTRCSNPDSIEHTFIKCHNSMYFYNLTLRWFNGMHNTEIDLSGDQFVRYMFTAVFLT